MNVVWFKRDLRWVDHGPLLEAARLGQVLPLYIVEPQLWQQPDVGHRHYAFLSESLIELSEMLERLGQSLVIRVGDVQQVFAALQHEHPITSVWSHQETGNDFTYQRDQRIATWFASHNITWHQLPQHGVIRCLANRDGWAKRWYQQMSEPKQPAMEHFDGVALKSEPLPTPEQLGLMDDGCVERQPGGRSHAIAMLNSFLHQRGEHYTREMSSPVTAFTSCSRLSAHITYGTLSIREVYQAAQMKSNQLRGQPPELKGGWPSAMRSFSGRLRWHCHFIQKLEDQPSIEFENLHPAYNTLRQDSWNEAYFKAWQQGKTGYPMIDACMRSLQRTGWLNFRMRAMLMSFASYHLWLHWRQPALHLARLFVDYEPGIHYSQVQMQSGTTGINAVRIYNPIKQSIDQDPEGTFIRQWLPELEDVPQAFIHTPWEVPHLLQDYPLPIVDEKQARMAASAQIYGLRGNTSHRQAAKKIVSKHGSRRKTAKRNSRTRQKPKDSTQGELPI